MRRPAVIRLDADYFLRQVTDLEDGVELTSDIWEHEDFEILKHNVTLRHKLITALRIHLRYRDARRARDALTWAQRALKPDKAERLDREVARLLAFRDEKAKAYEMFRRLAAYDCKSLEWVF